ncbi:MAG: YhdP family protein [Luteimonas sp.]
MPTPVRRRLRLARRGVWYALAGVLVLMALAAGIASQLLPLAERHPDRIAAWLSARAQRPVAFDHVETAWTRRGPLLRVDGLRIGEGADAVPIGEAEILVSQYAGLLPGRSFTELRLRGLALVLERGDDGRWQVRGLPGQAQSELQSDPLDMLQRLGELQVIDGRLTVSAPALGLEAKLPRVDLRLRVQDDRGRVAARAWPREGAVPMDGVLDFDRSAGDGKAYLALRQADLAAWAPLLQAAGIGVEAGMGRAALWAELRAHRIAVVTLDADLRALRLRGAPFPGSGVAGQVAPRLGLHGVQVRARWQTVEGGWRLDTPVLRMQREVDAPVARLDGVVIAGGARRVLLADAMDAAPLLALAALSDRMPAGSRRWLQSARPGMTLQNVTVVGRGDGPLHVSARIDDLHFDSGGGMPGVSGIGGVLHGDGDGVVFEFDSGNKSRLDWPRRLSAPHEIVLRGRLVGWRNGEGWSVQAPSLRIDGDGYGAVVRGGLRFQGDGTRPVIDLAASLEPSAVRVAKRFWIRDLMSPATLRWLDTALQHGQLRHGRAVVSGDLDHWPFPRGTGLFRAEVDLRDATIRFQEQWPPVKNLDARVVFEGDAFSVTGTGTLAGITVRGIDARIAHFGSAELKVRAQATTDAGTLLALLRDSPLREAHGETLQALRASGPVAATFALDLPLQAGGGRSALEGSLDLRGVKLAETRWDLAFADVRGQARYDREGFSADALKVVRDGQPGVLALRAGASHVRDRGQAFEAELEADLSAADLLQRAPQLDWLGPHIAGRSRWSTQVSLPAGTRGTAAVAGRLRLQSDLVGTRLDLPTPLGKPAVVALPTTVETRLPLGEGEVSVALGDRMALRARTRQGRTGVRVVLGENRVADAPPAHGLIATGRAAELDAIDWVTLATGAGGGDGEGNRLPLQRIDIFATRLRLLGSGFPDTRIRAVPASGGTAVQFEGASLSGSLLLPEAREAALAGRLQRLYWRSANDAAGARATSAEAIASDTTNPARIPSLNLVVDDLRFGDAVLGVASLQTRRTADGMRIEQLHMRSPGQSIEASGDWTGRGAAARTRLRVAVETEDFGALLAEFGFGGRIAGGHGTAGFEAAWPGSPARFRLDALQGRLALTMKDGRLVEIEPGAGRVLGLLSLAELPRRLTLDFRDFFAKGFAFNRIGGTVRFADGKARIDDLLIDGPAAEINIQGSADLRAQTYDQTIEVLPRTGNLLTAVGAIAGGPVGAAVGAVANAVLQKPLGELNAKVYRVTGPWKDPHVEVSGRGQAQQGAEAQPPARQSPPAG